MFKLSGKQFDIANAKLPEWRTRCKRQLANPKTRDLQAQHLIDQLRSNALALFQNMNASPQEEDIQELVKNDFMSMRGDFAARFFMVQ